MNYPINPFMCAVCGKVLIPDKESVRYETEEWDGHIYKYSCKCMNKNIRVSIG